MKGFFSSITLFEFAVVSSFLVFGYAVWIMGSTGKWDDGALAILGGGSVGALWSRIKGQTGG